MEEVPEPDLAPQSVTVRIDVGRQDDASVGGEEARHLPPEGLLINASHTHCGPSFRVNGKAGDLPEAGDKLVCLKNDRKKGLLNGSLWTVQTAGTVRRKKIPMTVVPEEDSAHKPLRIGVLPEFFTSEEEIPYSLRRESDEFDYGYALTVHKAQGSQWDKIVLFDESGAFREHRDRWLYTGITRAAETLTVVL